jgi:hypothetical protein
MVKRITNIQGDLQMRRLRKLAISDNVQRSYELVIQTTSIEDMIKYANLFRQSWNNGLDTGMVSRDEAEESKTEWVESYHMVISQDILTEAKKNEEVLAQLSVLSEEEYNDLFNMINDYVLQHTEEIASAIEGK